jgi:malonate-semialdehyde dehydrogenase (acetylating)/methylmalonate-semialdehyde dehydrogenase
MTIWRDCCRGGTAKPFLRQGDIQRLVRSLRVCPRHRLADGAGPGIDLFSMRQPLGVVAGVTPFNFPAPIPLWKCAPAIACSNTFILKPSARDPRC